MSQICFISHTGAMKHPTVRAHRIIEAFWCRTCVPGGGAWSLPYCFNMAVSGICFGNSCPILDYKYAISPLTLFQKSDEKCSKIVPALPSHIPKWLKGDPPGSYGPGFRGFLHNLVGTGRRELWERGCFLQVFWLLRGTVKQFHNTVLRKATSKPVCYSFL